MATGTQGSEITPLTDGEVNSFNNQSPANQNVQLGTKLQEIITLLNTLLTDDSQNT